MLNENQSECLGL